MSSNTATLNITVDMDAIKDAVAEAIREQIESELGSVYVSGIGANGDTDLEGEDIDIDGDLEDGFVVKVRLQRMQGLFVGNDEVTEAVIGDAPTSVSVSFDIDLEVDAA